MYTGFQRMISNPGDFGELQLVAPHLQREPNEGFWGPNNLFETITVLDEANFSFFTWEILSRSRFRAAST